MAAREDANQPSETASAAVQAVPDDLKKDAVAAAMEAVPNKLKKDAMTAAMQAVPDDLKKDAVAAAMEAVPNKLKTDAVAAAMEAVPNKLKKDAMTAAMQAVPDDLKKDAVAAAMQALPNKLKTDAMTAAMEAVVSASESRLEGIVGRAVAESVRNELRTPQLVKYEGWVRVDVVNEDGHEAEINKDDEIMLSPPVHFEVRVTIGPQSTGSLPVPQSTGSRLVALQISEGEESEFADFGVELDSDKRELCHAPVQLHVGRKESATVGFPLRLEDAASAPWLWVRVTQQGRTVQSLELHTRFVGAQK